MPKRYQRPLSSQLLSYFRASTPAANAKIAPRTPGVTAEITFALPWICSTRINLHASRAIAGGVRTTASAKLKSSARAFGTLQSMPVEIVAPERENPRKGRHKPCTAPMSPAYFRLMQEAAIWGTGERLSSRAAVRMRTPAAASAGAIRPSRLNNCSIQAFGAPRK